MIEDLKNIIKIEGGAFSKKFAPFHVLCKKEFKLKSEALKAEKFYKSTSGRREIKKLIEDFDNF